MDLYHGCTCNAQNDRESQLDKLKAELLIQEKNADRLASLKTSPWKAEARRLSNVPSTSSDVHLRLDD